MTMKKKETKTKMKCPYCNYEFDCHKMLSGNKNYKDKDISFCIKCGKVGSYENNTIVKIDEKSLPSDVQSEIVRVRSAWRKSTETYAM